MIADLDEIATPELVTETEPAPSTLAVRFVGSAEAATRSELARFLGGLHATALALPCAEVVLDVRAVDFFSASCVRAFSDWLADVEHAGRYRARFLVDERRPWQARTLQWVAGTFGNCAQLG